MSEARAMLDLAARLAMRAAGYVEPNPMVGAVIVRDGVVIGAGHHLKYGGLHAEREALADCRRRGHDPRGATMYVTLEPCRHVGKQPPCTGALIDAGLARVVYARTDPGRESGGGAAVLAAAGIACELTDASILATRLSDPFVKRATTGLPWVIAKWAQTIDGKIATEDGLSQWVTRPLLRRRAHGLRARIDAVMVGAGTLRADDPTLNARDVRVRRVARRVVVCTRWAVPVGAKLVQTARAVPTTFAGLPPAGPDEERTIADLRAAGVEVLTLHDAAGLRPGIDLRGLLAVLADHHGVSRVMVEGGATLLGGLFDADLVDEAVVHVAPMVLGDHRALSASAGQPKSALTDARRLVLCRVKRLESELELTYRRP